MNEKKKIILPDDQGVSSMEIKRLQKELAGKPPVVEMVGLMTAQQATYAITELRKIIDEIEKGSLSSIAVVSVGRSGKNLLKGKVTLSAPHNELKHVGELLVMAIQERDPELVK